jgi:hypothetical protein
MSRSRDLANLAGDATGLETLTVSDITDLTSTATELNKLDGFTGVVGDLNYAKDLNATGVTSTEFDYLDGVGSALQTQINAKASLSGATFTGDITMPTNKKVKQKGAFMQSSTHQALTLGL